jgi:hypothetical protein
MAVARYWVEILGGVGSFGVMGFLSIGSGGCGFSDLRSETSGWWLAESTAVMWM